MDCRNLSPHRANRAAMARANGYISHFDARQRDEPATGDIFNTLSEAQVLIEDRHRNASTRDQRPQISATIPAKDESLVFPRSLSHARDNFTISPGGYWS